MRFLLDANLSPLIAGTLREADHTVLHVREVNLRDATDEQIMDYAIAHNYVVVSQDTDFTNLLFYRRASRPSLVLLRNLREVSAAQIAELLLVNLPDFEKQLEHGAVVSIHADQIRVRLLPFT